MVSALTIQRLQEQHVLCSLLQEIVDYTVTHLTLQSCSRLLISVIHLIAHDNKYGNI